MKKPTRKDRKAQKAKSRNTVCLLGSNVPGVKKAFRKAVRRTVKKGEHDEFTTISDRKMNSHYEINDFK
jgi:hypothetical protein